MAKSSPAKRSEQSIGDVPRLPATPQATREAWFENRRVSKPSSLEKKVRGQAEIAGAATDNLPVKGEAELGLKVPGAPETETTDSGPVLDAWHASFSNAVTVAALKKHSENPELSPELVFSDDDRKQVTDTRAFPWQCICSLLITGSDGSRWSGTGWLAGPRTIITAGHCVYLHGHGGWARQVAVYPGRNGSDTSLGSFTSTVLHTVTGWTDHKSPLYDYGAIILPTETRLGWFAYGVYEREELQDLTVNVFGYPSDKEAGTLWGTARRLQQVIPQKLVYNLSTYGGQSGCPVFDKSGEQRIVVGIHNYGDVSGNSATRITDTVFNDIEKWKSEAA